MIRLMILRRGWFLVGRRVVGLFMIGRIGCRVMLLV